MGVFRMLRARQREHGISRAFDRIRHALKPHDIHSRKAIEDTPPESREFYFANVAGEFWGDQRDVVVGYDPSQEAQKPQPFAAINSQREDQEGPPSVVGEVNDIGAHALGLSNRGVPG